MQACHACNAKFSLGHASRANALIRLGNFAEPRWLAAVLAGMTQPDPDDPKRPEPGPIEEQEAERARLYAEQAREAGKDMPGMRAPLATGSLDKLPTDPQGDEHREPPPGAPQRPPESAASQPTVTTGYPRAPDHAARGD